MGLSLLRPPSPQRSRPPCAGASPSCATSPRVPAHCPTWRSASAAAAAHPAPPSPPRWVHGHRVLPPFHGHSTQSPCHGAVPTQEPYLQTLCECCSYRLDPGSPVRILSLPCAGGAAEPVVLPIIHSCECSSCQGEQRLGHPPAPVASPASPHPLSCRWGFLQALMPRREAVLLRAVVVEDPQSSPFPLCTAIKL